jgi:hypothetical protein
VGNAGGTKDYFEAAAAGTILRLFYSVGINWGTCDDSLAIHCSPAPTPPPLNGGAVRLSWRAYFGHISKVIPYQASNLGLSKRKRI